MTADSHVWYVSYGSNLCADRLACYLRGGRPEGGLRSYPGARDTSPPLDSSPTTLPGRIFFAGESRTWRGGMAFYDHTALGPTPAAAYLITVAQFADVAVQESDREPAADTPLEAALHDPSLLVEPGDEHLVDDGLYGRLLRVATLDGLPALTFTSPTGLAGAVHTEPSEPYRTMIGRGLAETHGWDEAAIDAYVRARTIRDTRATEPVHQSVQEVSHANSQLHRVPTPVRRSTRCRHRRSRTDHHHSRGPRRRRDGRARRVRVPPRDRAPHAVPGERAPPPRRDGALGGRLRRGALSSRRRLACASSGI